MSTSQNSEIVVPIPEPPKVGTRGNPSIAGPSQPGPKEHWDMIRGAIVHEDNLINHRLTWLLTSHAFMFAAFAAVQNVVMTKEISRTQIAMLELLLIVLFGYSILLCHSINFAVSLAHKHLAHLRCWWMTTYPSECRKPISVPKQFIATAYLIDWIPIVNLFRLIYVQVFRYRWLEESSFEYEEKLESKKCEACEPQEAIPTNYPPIGGWFNLNPYSSTKSVTWILLQIDIVLLLCSAIILYVKYTSPQISIETT